MKLLSRRENSPMMRLGAILLAFLLFIAPTWHVCEMSGVSCCPSVSQQADAQGKLLCCPGSSSLHQKNEAPHSAYSQRHQEGTCLAKLLMGMPGSFAAVPQQVALTPRENAFRVDAYVLPTPAAATLPPARAPPLSPFEFRC